MITFSLDSYQAFVNLLCQLSGGEIKIKLEFGLSMAKLGHLIHNDNFAYLGF